MPTLATDLIEGFSSGNTKRYQIEAIHTAAAPQTVTQHVRVGTSSSNTVGTDLVVALTTSDAATSVQMSQKIVGSVEVRFPANCVQADVSAAISYLRDIVASDEFESAVLTQAPIK